MSNRSLAYLIMQEEFDTHDPKSHEFLRLPFLKKRSRIVEIVAARDIVFALAHSGVCAAFSRGETCFSQFEGTFEPLQMLINCILTLIKGALSSAHPEAYDDGRVCSFSRCVALCLCRAVFYVLRAQTRSSNKQALTCQPILVLVQTQISASAA